MSSLKWGEIISTTHYQWRLSSNLSSPSLTWLLWYVVLPLTNLPFVQRILLTPWARRQQPFWLARARPFVLPVMIPTIQYILQTFLVPRNPSEATLVLQSLGRRTSQSRNRTPTYLHRRPRTTGTCAFFRTVYFSLDDRLFPVPQTECKVAFCSEQQSYLYRWLG
jgi:hypothetical protein